MTSRIQRIIATLSIFVFTLFDFAACESKSDKSDSESPIADIVPPPAPEPPKPNPNTEPKRYDISDSKGAFPWQRRVDVRFLEEVIKRSGNALARNKVKRAPRLDGPDEEQASLAVYLMDEFGFRHGDHVSEKTLAGLLKAVYFSSLCAGKDLINDALKVTRPTEAIQLFHDTISKEEMCAFDHMNRGSGHML